MFVITGHIEYYEITNHTIIIIQEIVIYYVKVKNKHDHEQNNCYRYFLYF